MTGINMSFDPILAIISIIFGIIVIAVPEIIGWIVGIFFVLLGIWLLLDYMNRGKEKGTTTTTKTTEMSSGPPEKK
jgi:putative Ca2+/H+ antiporter (TMEM165/GDT1 family)